MKIMGTTGDMYQMLKGSTSSNNKVDTTALNLISSTPEEGEEQKKKKDIVSSVLGEGASVSNNTNRTVDTGENTLVTDSETSTPTQERKERLEDVFNKTLALQRVWMGDDYTWSSDEAETFSNLIKVSANPEETASRYIASKGIARRIGGNADVEYIYKHLDEISQYYTGEVYDPKQITLAQKFLNGWTRNEMMSLEYEYMLAHSSGNDEKAEAIDQEIQKKQATLDDNSSSIPLSMWDKISTAVLENFAYMVQPSAEGAAAASVVNALGTYAAAVSGIYAPAVLASTKVLSVATAKVFSGKRMYEWSAGEAYYNYMHDEQYYGVQNREEARTLATVEGLGTAVVETILDGVTSRFLGGLTGGLTGGAVRGIGINTLAELGRKGLWNAVAAAAFDWVTGGVDEGLFNELPEYILGEIGSTIYKHSNGIINEKTWADRKAEIIESVQDGMIVGWVYGAFSVPSSIRYQRSMARELRQKANVSGSMSEFENVTKDMKPEGLSDSDYDKARTLIWNASQNQKEGKLQKMFGGTVLESEEVASKELFSTVDPMTGEDTARALPDGTVYRTDDNALYSEVHTDNKTGAQTVWYGNPDDGSVYGLVQISSDGDTQTVESVRVRTGYEGIRSEMVKDALSNTLSTETNVEWNPTTKGLQSVKEELINNNPDKTGLVYSSQLRGRDSDIQSLKTRIKTASPQVSDAEATMAARLTSIADVGTGTIKYETATAANTKRNPADIRGATNLAKALIYTGQNADSSTFVHELFHAVASVRVKEAESLSNEIRTALQEEGTRSQLESFIKNNLAVWGTNADINTIMSSLSEIKENSNAKGWSVAQNENLARLYEAYRRSERSIRQSLPQAIRNLLAKLTQFMNKVYGTLKDTVPLNENIAKAYDSLMGFEDMASEAKRVESQEVFKEFRGISEKAEDNILFKKNKDNIIDLTEELSVTKAGDISEADVENYVKGLIRQAFDTATIPLKIQVTEYGEKHVIDPNVKLTKNQRAKHNAALFQLDRIIGNAVYSSEEDVDYSHNTSKKTLKHKENVLKYVYFKTPVLINEKPYVIKLTTERAKGQDANILDLYNVKVEKISRANAHLSTLWSAYDDKISTSAQEVKLFQDLNYNPDEKNLTKEDIILAQDKLLDDIDSVSNIDEAEAIAREEYANTRTEELSKGEKETAERVFEIDASLPEGWENIYESDAADRLEEEIKLEKALSGLNETLKNWDKLEDEGVEQGLVVGAGNLNSSYRLFVDGNSPDIEYLGNDTQRDAIFKKAIKDETVLRQYLAIMGEAYLYDTTITNREYEQVLNETWHRWEYVPVTVPYVDDAYRQTLHERLTTQLANRGLGGAMKAALTNSDMSEAVIKKVQKELGDNARFYRNILALLMQRQDMLPDSLMTETKGLDIPSRTELDTMSVTEFADLAKKANNERLRQKILSGTAKFGSDEDQAKYKEIVSYTKELDKNIQEKTKEIENLEEKGEAYEKRVEELEALNKERTQILLNADEIFNTLADTYSPENKNKEYRQEAVKKYNDLRAKYELMSPAREQEYQEATTERLRDHKIKDGSTFREKKTKGSAGWRQQYRGAKYGSEAWVNEITTTYEDIKERVDAEYNKDKRKAYRDVARSVIEQVREEVLEELNNARVDLISNSVNALVRNSNKIYSTLSAIKAITDGTGTVIANVDLEALRASEKELINGLKKEQRKVSARDAKIEEKELLGRWRLAKEKHEQKEKYEQKISDARTEERWKAAKEKQALLKEQEQEIINQKYILKSTIKKLREKGEQEIKNLKEEYRQKEKEKRTYQAIRDEKQKIANAIMRPVSLKSIDYSKAKEIQAIQALIDPEFRREWVYDVRIDPAQNPHYGTVTVQEAKDYINTLTDQAKRDFFALMPQSLVERLTEQRKPLNDWTLTELEQMASSVEMLREEGRAILRAKTDLRNAQAREIKRSILKAMGAFDNNDGGSIPSSLQRLSEGKGFKARLHSIMFRTRRMQELAQLLDGGYGNKGEAYHLLVEEKRWHQDNEARAIEQRYDAVKGYVNNKTIDQMSEKVTVDLGRGKTADFTVDQLAYAWLSQYDEDNKNAVMYGSLMTEGEKGTVEQKGKDVDYLGNKITTREWLIERSELIEDDDTFIQIAKERYDALIKTAEKELTNRGLWDLVNAINKDFNNPDNTKRLDAASIEYFNTPLSSKANYLPIKRMAMTGENLDNATADSMFNLNANKVVRDPAKGFLIERIEIAPRHQKQVDMSLLNVWQNSVKEQEHIIEFAGYVKKLRSVFESQKSSEVEREVNKRWSPALMREVKDYIELVANPDSSSKKDPTNELFKTIRGRTGAAYLGWKTSGVVLQAITSPASAFSELKPWEVFGAYAQIGAHPIETINTINEKSQMMKNRTMNQIVDEAVQRRNQWMQSKASRRLNTFEEVGQIGLTLVDRYAVAGPWLAMYERTLREGDKLGLDTVTSETRAVQRADEFILRTQPVGDPTELASFFRTKSEATKTILQFQTSLNVVWNNITANTVGFIRQKKYASAIGNIVGYAVAGVLLGLVQNGFDDDDDGKDKALKTIYWSLSQGVGSIPVAGSSIDSLSKYLITGDYDWYMNKGISISPICDKTIQALVAATGGDGWKALERSAEAVGIGMGLPVSGAKELWSAVEQRSLAPFVGRE